MIPFIQFLLPHGTQHRVEIPRPPEIEAKAQQI